jgi:hypothetical protein
MMSLNEISFSASSQNPLTLYSHVRRGAEVTSAENFQHLLLQKQQKLRQRNSRLQDPEVPVQIGPITLPSYLEPLRVLAVGSSGSGKTQMICRLVSTLLQRPDYRVIVLDRNGELAEKFFNPRRHLLLNPLDQRSVMWSHQTEMVYGEVTSDMIAQAIVDESAHKEPFWPQAAAAVYADLMCLASTNADLCELLYEASHKDLAHFIKGPSARMVDSESEKTRDSILMTLANDTGFHRLLSDEGEPFSAFAWARSDDPRSVFVTLFESQVQQFKSFYSCIFELTLLGLLSNEERRLKTVVIIDELGALQKLSSLSRLLAESRKFKGGFIGATQTLSQVRRAYGQDDLDVLLQNSRIKLVLNSPDPATAELLARSIGLQERVELTRSVLGGQLNVTESIRETYAVHPAELQNLPEMTGYLHVNDGTPATLIEVDYHDYPAQAVRFMPRSAKPAEPRERRFVGPGTFDPRKVRTISDVFDSVFDEPKPASESPKPLFDQSPPGLAQKLEVGTNFVEGVYQPTTPSRLAGFLNFEDVKADVDPFDPDDFSD